MALCFRNIKRHMCMLMRQNFAKSCEKKLNDQINMELKACHQYLAMVSGPGAGIFGMGYNKGPEKRS